MCKVLVIGFGNPFRADDGVGFRAADGFDAENLDHAGIEVIATLQLKPEHIETASRADLVVFIDASSRGVPGTVCSRHLDAVEEKCDGIFSHQLTPGSLLAAARVIYRRSPQGVLISVSGENFGFSSQLSPCVEAALPRVFARIREAIASARTRETLKVPAEQAGV